jgi:hypothetical protein
MLSRRTQERTRLRVRDCLRDYRLPHQPSLPVSNKVDSDPPQAGFTLPSTQEDSNRTFTPQSRTPTSNNFARRGSADKLPFQQFWPIISDDRLQEKSKCQLSANALTRKSPTLRGLQVVVVIPNNFRQRLQEFRPNVNFAIIACRQNISQP